MPLYAFPHLVYVTQSLGDVRAFNGWITLLFLVGAGYGALRFLHDVLAFFSRTRRALAEQDAARRNQGP